MIAPVKLKNTTRKNFFLFRSIVYKKGAHVANLNVHAFYIASRGTAGRAGSVIWEIDVAVNYARSSRPRLPRHPPRPTLLLDRISRTDCNLSHDNLPSSPWFSAILMECMVRELEDNGRRTIRVWYTALEIVVYWIFQLYFGCLRWLLLKSEKFSS